MSYQSPSSSIETRDDPTSTDNHTAFLFLFATILFSFSSFCPGIYDVKVDLSLVDLAAKVFEPCLLGYTIGFGGG
jgi:hypothetical protein